MGELDERSIAALEARIAELEDRVAPVAVPDGGPRRLGRSRRRAAAVVGLLAVLAITPAVIAGGVFFNDVPPGHPYFNDIAAIANAGVTVGCGGGNYCPDDFVTREQMAAFLNRLGALAPGKTPVVNAYQLDGRPANNLVRAASQTTAIASPVLTAAETVYLTVSIDAPSVGYVLVNVALTGREQACTLKCTMQARIRHVELVQNSPVVTAWIHERTNIALTYRFAVQQGPNTFHTRISRPEVGGDGNMNGWYNQMTALFVPFNEIGHPPN